MKPMARRSNCSLPWLPNVVLLVFLLCVSACSHNPDKVPVVERSTGRLNSSGYYIVQPGDSLYSIAWNYGLEFRSLARANGLPSPYTIHPGDKLRLRAASAANSGVSSRSPTTRSSGSTGGAATRHSAGVPATNKEQWLWPASGSVIRFYSASRNLHKGIDIQGKIGQSVLAAKSGKVVYAGKGLKAYGLLVIVKHDTHYLSAYAYNRSASVKEGDRVKKGQQIARMGTRDGKQAMLHFEIRRDGKTVNPMTLLPRR
jgi:lipoprotein NlpD